jgi:hypothetical protein
MFLPLLVLLGSGAVGVLADPEVFSHVHHEGRNEADAFSNEWVVHLEGGRNVADLIAIKQGYQNLGEVYKTSHEPLN